MPGLNPQTLPVAVPATVLAAGAFLKNRACLLHGRELLWSPLHGDLSDPAACLAMEEALQALVNEAHERGWHIEAVAHDLHPDFPSTCAAEAWARNLGVPAWPVQHHHAHLGVVMAEQGWNGEEPVHGLALDGVGLGTDGTSWGGEFLAARAGSFERLAHLPPLPLPGGDAAAREPWRLAAAVLHGLGRAGEIAPRFGPLVGEQIATGVATLLERDVRCPRSSGAGRWFDAAAAALRLAPRRQQEAEAAIALERAATAWLESNPLPDLSPEDLDLPALVGRLFDEPDSGRGATVFHAALAAGLVQSAAASGANRLALTGGCFHNRLLSREIERGCSAHGIATFRPLSVDCGDAGLALGQAWLASHASAAKTAGAKEMLSCA
jgi:hydrogenase maturation protein HypF